MADISVRATAASCLGVNPPFSVNSDVYGYIFRDNAGTVGISADRSLLTQLQLMKGRAINICIFLVGHENDFSGVVTLAQAVSVQVALQTVRNLYGQVNLGVRKLFWRRISMADVGNYAIITDQPEAEDLTDDFSGPNDGIDVFYVQSILNAGGWSEVGGSCDKDEKDEMTGAVIELSSGIMGILTAHEVGHYLGLSHGTTITNVMGVDSNNDGIGELNSTSTNLTSSQGTTMRGHCTVRSPC
ncbi:MAG TPA: hypothetical protein VFW95_07185 [Candidatus Limnocylindria bacterium]|nr:hypothetical protein [Candidatus Limnocylindria bacterium]